MENLTKICEKEKITISSRRYFTFEEMFLEEPQKQYPGENKINMCPSIPVPVPTFSTFKGIPYTDDVDFLE